MNFEGRFVGLLRAAGVAFVAIFAAGAIHEFSISTPGHNDSISWNMIRQKVRSYRPRERLTGAEPTDITCLGRL